MPSDQELREREANSKDFTEGGVNSWGRDKYGERVFYDENGAVVKNTLKDFYNMIQGIYLGLDELSVKEVFDEVITKTKYFDFQIILYPILPSFR